MPLTVASIADDVAVAVGGRGEGVGVSVGVLAGVEL
jgi:hypothetical protein